MAWDRARAGEAGGGAICRSVGKMRTRHVHLVQLLLICLLASTTFAFGFLVAVRPLGNANPSPPAPRHSSLPPHPQTASPSVAPPALADPGEAPVAVGVDFESLEEREPADKGVLKTATFTKILPFPFEQVRDYWENGPPDPNFIREEIVLQVNGAEEHRSKTIYTNNPLPWILKKTVRLPVQRQCVLLHMRRSHLIRFWLALCAAHPRRLLCFPGGAARQLAGQVFARELLEPVPARNRRSNARGADERHR